MSFFKDFKDDFSDAVDEMSNEKTDASKKGTSGSASGAIDDSSIDVDSELSKLDGLLEKVSKKVDAPAEEKKPAQDTPKETASEILRKDSQAKKPAQTQQAARPKPQPAPAAVQTDTDINSAALADSPKENRTMDYTAPVSDSLDTLDSRQGSVSDENAVITSGMTITGDLDSTGSISVEGTINGNVRCNGKLTVTGAINGNSQTSEFIADSARIQGEVVSSGTVKIGVGSVIIGNVSAASAVVAGAVKGDIDVQGPVVIDTSAVVMGNIKSKSVQINNGAIIEGFCSQAYADVDVSAVFGEGNN